MQELVDAVGKLGPLCVAVAVYLANRAQTKWTNAMSGRSAAVEDQKLRLALLDRRLLVIDAVRDASHEFFASVNLSSDTVERVRQAILIAQSVYGDAEEVAIQDCLKRIHIWRLAEMRVQKFNGSRDIAKEEAAHEARSQAEENLFEILSRLPEQLRDATRVTIVPPVTPNPSILLGLRNRLFGSRAR